MSRVLSLIVAVALLATACQAESAGSGSGQVAEPATSPPPTATAAQTTTAAAPEAVAIAQPDPVDDVEQGPEICADLAVAYDARSRFRAALAIDPSERRSLSLYLQPIYFMRDELRDLDRSSTDLLPFSIDGFSGLYQAEHALADRIDDGDVMDRAVVEEYEMQALAVHAFTRENCPTISDVDLPSVFEHVPMPDEAEVGRLRTAFCSNYSALLTNRAFVRASVDDIEGPQAFSIEIAKAMHEMAVHTDAIAEDFRTHHATIDPEGVVDLGMVADILRAEILVRQANFEPVVIPIPIDERSDVSIGDIADSDALGRFLSSTCPNLDQGLLLLPTARSMLPGPTFPALPSRTPAEDLCRATQRAVEARAGYHAAIRRHLDGDPYAVADALSYRTRFLFFASFSGVSMAFPAAFPDADEEVARSWVYVEGQLSNAFEGANTRREDLLLELDRLPIFVEMVMTACPTVTTTEFGSVDETLALFDQLDVGYELPAGAGVQVVCAYMDRVFQKRVAVRAIIQADDAAAGNSPAYGIYNESAYGIELPDGFDPGWVSSLGSAEGRLYNRFAFGTPQATQDILSWENDVAQLVDWIESNCPENSAGLDLVSTLDVFPRPAVDETNRARNEFCSSVSDLYLARIEFRSHVEQPQADFPDVARTAYFSVIASAEDFDRVWSEHRLLVDPDGIAKFRQAGQAITRTESMVRQAHFGPDPIPMVLNSGFDVEMDERLANFVLLSCEELSDAVTTDVAPLAELDGQHYVSPSRDASESELASAYCQSLEVALLARFNFLSHLRAAAQDSDAALDATHFYNRLANVSYGDQLDAAFGEGDRHADLLLLPNPYGLPEILARAAAGESTFDDRRDLEFDVADPEVINPRAVAQCPALPSELFDLDVPDALQLFDDLTAAQ